MSICLIDSHNIPFSSQAHISLNGRSANNNNSNDEATESGNQTQSDNAESTTSSRVNTEDGNQERDNVAQSQTERSQQDQGQSPFGTFRFIAIQRWNAGQYVEMHVTFLDTVFNLPNNVEVLMEVSSESNIDAGSSGEQTASGNETNNNARKLMLSCIT